MITKLENCNQIILAKPLCFLHYYDMGKAEIRFFEEILYPELIKDEIDFKTKEKFIKLLPKILQAMKEKKHDELSRLRYLKKEIEHLKGIVKLQKNYVGTLGTESYFRVNEIIKEAKHIHKLILDIVYQKID